MVKYYLIAFIVLVSFISCTDSESEEIIEGHWHAVKMVDEASDEEHDLPNGFHLNFDYPKYNFEGDEDEKGNYYIQNDKLHLIPRDENTQRELTVRKLTRDSLVLQLQDSLGMRSVLFLRKGQ